MSTKKKMLQAAAGNAGGEALNVEEVFSTYLYEGNGSTQTITNGIDLDGEGGLVWIKERNNVSDHGLFDTERGKDYRLRSNTTNSQTLNSGWVTSFNYNGLGVGSSNSSSGSDYASWTFRKALKFFDVVTYTGDGTSGRAISHNLGQKPGMFVVKATSKSTNWNVYHRSLGATKHIFLNLTNAEATATNKWNDTEPTDTHFTVDTHGDLNTDGSTYVAYLFAHNDGDGGFNGGDIIKCGSYTGNGSTDGPEIDLGFEPQWIFQKRADNTGNWRIFDNLRGLVVGGNDAQLFPNNSDAEASGNMITPTSTGFQLTTTTSNLNASGGNYIYIAIRRGTKVPESGTEVFAIDTKGAESPQPAYVSGFPVDMALVRNNKNTVVDTQAFDRMRWKFLQTSTNAADSAASYPDTFDHNTGFHFTGGPDTNDIAWMWKRAPNFFDVVAYTGDGVAGRTVSHNLGVAPEMIWVKRRDANRDWAVYAEALGNSQHLHINQTFSSAGTTMWDYTDPTDSVFSVGSSLDNNGSSATYIAYLFASLDGVSKVGSFSHTNGSTTDVDCGFSNGARFVLIRQYDGTNNWLVVDTERGINAGNDPYLMLNSTNAEATGDDIIDPLSSGFQAQSVLQTGNYIFYAIA